MIPGSKGKHPSFKRGLLFAIQGIRVAFAQEANLRRMALIAFITVIVGFIVRLDVLSWVVVLACIGSVLTTELLNTAIETVVDLVSPEFHPMAGKAKDIAAAASACISITAACIGLLVFLRAIFTW
ncbi:MAG: diacylglycerol kinase family protein [Atopobiaceae bacterium]|nr:diacylglycerol kinase family protein [Atopobiaceae bacterium]